MQNEKIFKPEDDLVYLINNINYGHVDYANEFIKSVRGRLILFENMLAELSRNGINLVETTYDIFESDDDNLSYECICLWYSIYEQSENLPYTRQLLSHVAEEYKYQFIYLSKNSVQVKKINTD